MRIGYQFAQGSIAIAYGKTTLRPTAAGATATGGDYTDANLGASYDFGFVRINAIYDVQKQKEASGIRRATRESTGYMLAAVVPIGSTQIKATVGSSRKSDASVASINGNKVTHFGLGAVHNLSKRTAIYTTVAKVRNSGGSAIGLAGAVTGPNQSSSGFDIGLRHSF